MVKLLEINKVFFSCAAEVINDAYDDNRRENPGKTHTVLVHMNT